tara:strand:+ start:4387 stop:4587 length:201 start_codon:yes stop_codon:yes gene_type:complete
MVDPLIVPLLPFIAQTIRGLPKNPPPTVPLLFAERLPLFRYRPLVTLEKQLLLFLYYNNYDFYYFG